MATKDLTDKEVELLGSMFDKYGKEPFKPSEEEGNFRAIVRSKYVDRHKVDGMVSVNDVGIRMLADSKTTERITRYWKFNDRLSFAYLTKLVMWERIDYICHYRETRIIQKLCRLHNKKFLFVPKEELAKVKLWYQPKEQEGTKTDGLQSQPDDAKYARSAS